MQYYIQDGTIGDDLVVKPLPAALRSKLHQQNINVMSLTDNDFDDIDSSDSLFVSSHNHRRTNENDDYAFLDEDILEDEDDDDVKDSLKLNYLRQAEPEYEQEFDSNRDYQNRRREETVRILKFESFYF